MPRVAAFAALASLHTSTHARPRARCPLPHAPTVARPLHPPTATARAPRATVPSQASQCPRPPQTSQTSPAHHHCHPQTPSPESAAADTAFWLSLFSEAALIPVALAVSLALQRPVLGPGFLSHLLPGFRLALLATPPFVALFASLSAATAGVAPASSSAPALRLLFEHRRLSEIVLFCGAAAVGEELLFRGVLQAAVADVFGSSGVGLVAASLVFGVMHAHGPLYSALATLAGGLFGWLYVAGGGSVLPGVVVHFFYDLVALHVLKAQWMMEEVATAGAALAEATLLAPLPHVSQLSSAVVVSCDVSREHVAN